MPSQRAREIPNGSIPIEKIAGLLSGVQRHVEVVLSGSLDTLHLTDLVDVPDPPSGIAWFIWDGSGYVFELLSSLHHQQLADQEIIANDTIAITTNLARITSIGITSNLVLTMPPASGDTALRPFVELIIKDETGLLTAGPPATKVTLTAHTGDTFEGGATTVVMNAAYAVTRWYNDGAGVWHKV